MKSGRRIKTKAVSGIMLTLPVNSLTRGYSFGGVSQQYAILGKVAKEIGKVYEKSGDENLTQLAQSYYTMEEEAKYLSKLVEKQLKNTRIADSSKLSGINRDATNTTKWRR